MLEPEEVECPDCDGVGVMLDYRCCRRCEGTGILPEDEDVFDPKYDAWTAND